MQEKLARYLEIFGVQSQEALTQALGLVTDGRVPLDQEGNQQWPKVGDSADFLLTLFLQRLNLSPAKVTSAAVSLKDNQSTTHNQ